MELSTAVHFLPECLYQYNNGGSVVKCGNEACKLYRKACSKRCTFAIKGTDDVTYKKQE